MRPRWFVGLALAGVLATACGSAPSSSSRVTARATSTPTGKPTPTASPCAVAAQAAPPATLDVAFATALAFAPDGRLFVAERAGTVLVWQSGALQKFAAVATVTTEADGSYSERGLLGLALDPQFVVNHLVYAFYSDTNRTQQHVIRWTDCAGVASSPTVLVTLPSGPDCCHKGGRIAFGSDGKLYVSLGEEHDAPAAQNTADVRGKILRYNADGSVPADNPFGADNPVWAYGLRNPFGIAFSESGQLAVTTNGPSGDAGSPRTGYDTVILSVTRGERLQWPRCYGYSHPLQASACLGTPPDWSSESTTYVPTGATFVDAAGPAPYAGHLVACTYERGMIVLTPGSPHATVSAGPSTCRLDVIEGTDHALYFSDDTHVYRIA